VCVVYLSCRLLFVLKYFTSLKTASKAAEKASRRHKTRYDLKVRNSVLKQGDRVLLKNNHIRGKQKLAHRWNREPYVIDSQPDHHSSICN
jgi:hypothetical protein